LKDQVFPPQREKRFKTFFLFIVGYQTSPFGGIDAIVADHLELAFRDVNDEFLDEFVDIFGDNHRSIFLLVRKQVILMRLVGIGDLSLDVIDIIDTGFSHHGSTGVSEHVFDEPLLRFGIRAWTIDIEAVFFFGIEHTFFFIEPTTQLLMEQVKKCLHERFSQKFKVEVNHRLEITRFIDHTLRDESVDMTVEIERSAKRVTDQDIPEFPALRFSVFKRQVLKRLIHSIEQDI